MGKEPLILPNHSGDNFKGFVSKPPANHFDYTNKKYVDDSIPANVFLFFTENGSDLGGVYLDMETSPVTAGEENTLTAIPANSTGTLMATYATILNDFTISRIVELPVGVYGFHVHCEASSADKLSMYAELYHRTAGGTETLLFTSEDSNLISIVKGSISFHGTLTTEKEWTSTDRIIIKLYGKNNSAAARNLTIYVEGNTSTRAELPAIKGIVTELWKRTGTILSPKTAGDGITVDGIINADGNVGGLGLDVLRSAMIGIHLEVGDNITLGGNIIVGGTVDGIDIGTDVAANTAKAAGLWEVDGTEHQLITADEIDMQNKKILNLTTPTNVLEGANKTYVDEAKKTLMDTNE